MKEKKIAIEDLKTNGLKFYRAGNYKKALSYFETAYSKDVLQPEEKLQLASLFLQEEKLQKADLIIGELSESSLLKNGDWFLLNGLMSFFQEDFSRAEEYFNQSLGQKKEVSLVNLAILKWKMRDYQKSLFYLDQLTKMAYERDISFYLKALNLLSQDRISDLTHYINQELYLGQNYALVREYQQEFYFMLAYSYMKEQNQEELKKAVQNLLNQDPFFYKEYQYSSFMAVGGLNWSYFYPYCKSIFDFDPKSSLLNALYGFCHLKAGDLKQGSEYIEQAKNREPDQPFFLSLYAYFLMLKEESLQLEQVFDLIDYSHLGQNQTLPFILKARFFEKKQDWVKALSAWKALLSLDAMHLSGIAGVSVASYKLGDYLTADVYKNKVLDEYPYHVRLLSYKK